MGIELTPESIRLIVGKLILLVLAICVHEFGHAYVADRLGDDTPRRQGRVTLNPFAHADPIGTLALPGLALLFTGGTTTGFGWGRPVMTNPARYSRRFSMRVGQMFVAFAGPAMNVLFGVLIAAVLMGLLKGGVLTYNDTFSSHHWGYMLRDAVLMNFTLFFFNLIPFPPLDGGYVADGLLPTSARHAYHEISRYGFFVIIAVCVSPTLGAVVHWPAFQLYRVVAAVFGIA
jgi:Zn-dependent protease